MSSKLYWLARGTVAQNLELRLPHLLVFESYEAMDGLYRYPEGLTDKEKQRRERIIARTARPGLLRKLARRIRNWIGMVRDALLQAVMMIVGMAKTRTPGSAVISSQEGHIKAFSSEIIGHAGNAYDPLLEAHLFTEVVVEVTREDRKYNYCGWLKDYTSRFIEIVDASVQTQETSLPLADYTANDPRCPHISVQVEEGRLRISNESAQMIYVERIEAGSWTRPIGCVLPPAYIADLPVASEFNLDALRVRIGSIKQFDMVVPRTHALIRHAAIGSGG